MSNDAISSRILLPIKKNTLGAGRHMKNSRKKIEYVQTFNIEQIKKLGFACISSVQSSRMMSKRNK